MRRAGPFGIRLPRAVSAAVVGLCALVVASCGSAKYEYLSDDDVGVYIKVPNDWTVIGEDQILDGLGLSPANLAAWKRFGWAVNAASRAVRQPDGQVAVDLHQPWLEILVQPLTRDEHDVISNAAMENAITSLQQLPADQYDLLTSGSVVLDGGFHGIQREFELRGSDGTYTHHLELVVTNPQSSRIYMLSIVCTPECFDQYSGDISEVYGSWTIKEP
jgi:hypothetical protein